MFAMIVEWLASRTLSSLPGSADGEGWVRARVRQGEG